MTLNLLKRSEKGSALTVSEHDSNMTAIETEVNAKVDTTAVPDIVGAMVVASGGDYDAETGILTFPVGGTLDPVTDSRMALVWDGDLDLDDAHYTTRYSVQARDFPAPAQNTLTSSLLHSDSSVWVGLETSSGHSNKPAITLRLRQGQGGHWATESSPTNRAELHGPSDNFSGPLTSAFDENGGTYWLAFDFAADNDIITNSGLQSSGARNTLAIGGLHSQNWATTWAASSGQDSMRMWLKGNTLVWGHAAPGTGNWQRCDVRTVPLNTTFVTGESAGSDYGLPREWSLMDLNAGQRARVIAKVTLSSTSTHSPRTEIWTQQGDGALIKRVDYSGPNTYSTGIRYWKWGQYAWEVGSTWWGSTNTRTIRARSMLLMRDEVASGVVALTPNSILAWLNR